MRQRREMSAIAKKRRQKEREIAAYAKRMEKERAMRELKKEKKKKLALMQERIRHLDNLWNETSERFPLANPIGDPPLSP